MGDKIIQRKKQIVVHEVYGRQFLDKEEAKTFASKIKTLLTYTYYTVACNPDLTEGRGYQSTITLAVPESYCKNILFQYLVNTYGKPLEFVMGVSPMDNWRIAKGQKFKTLKELGEFWNSTVSEGIGDYCRPVKRVITFLDRNGLVTGSSTDYPDLFYSKKGE